MNKQKGSRIFKRFSNPSAYIIPKLLCMSQSLHCNECLLFCKMLGGTELIVTNAAHHWCKNKINFVLNVQVLKKYERYLAKR